MGSAYLIKTRKQFSETLPLSVKKCAALQNAGCKKIYQTARVTAH